MNQEEFIKEHPGLKGKKIYDGNPTEVGDEILCIELEDIHETQIDKEIIRKRIEKLESMGTICHQWNANELRTLIKYWEKHPKPKKAEKEYALNEVKKIIKNYGLDFIDKAKVKEAIENAIRFTKRYNQRSKNYECEMRLKDLKKELEV